MPEGDRRRLRRPRKSIPAPLGLSDELRMQARKKAGVFGARGKSPRPRKGSFTKMREHPNGQVVGPRLAFKNRAPLLGAKRRCPMGVAGWRFARKKRTIRVRESFVGLLEELPFICPVIAAVGSTVMIVIKLFKDMPQ